VPVRSDPALVELVRNVVRRALRTEATRVELLEAGLSLRRFARVRLGDGSSLIARIDTPEDPAGRPRGIPPEPPLEPVLALLARHGLPVPAYLGGDAAAGIDLLEDVGSLSLADRLEEADAGERRALYAEACDIVARLQRVADPGHGVAAFERRLDAAHFEYKADLFVRWSLPARGRRASPAEAACVRQAFACVAAEALAAPQRLAHRDFQSANLHVRPGGATSASRLVMIDLQGALLAPPEYDLVCLLRDSYVELPAAEIESHLEDVRPRLPDAPDPDLCRQRFDLLSLTRKGKDHARFLYAARTRGDARYLTHVPITVRHLRSAAARAAARDPRFEDLADLIHQLPETPCAR
jgi:aminoglycoside/choline kinase family phosphotransferase